MSRPLLFAALLAMVVAVPAGTATAEILANKALNYSIETPLGWTRESQKPSWDKDGIVEGSKRLLEKLYDGKPAKGQAGQMHLSIQSAPEGKTLADVAADPLQREFMLRFFGVQADWPAVESEETKIKGENGEAKALRLICLLYTSPSPRDS